MMERGPKLDRMVAEKVIGWHIGMRQWDGWNYHDDSYPNSDSKIWAPSTDIAHAWEVVGKMCMKHFSLYWCDSSCEWLARFDGRMCVGKDAQIKAFAETAPHAICLASLMAVGAIEK